MTIAKINAPAKINLTLHVTGQRADGYHCLHSLVVFADIADQITAQPAQDLRLTVQGPFSNGVPSDHHNLVLRAAQTLRDLHGITRGAALTLDKNLPHAAGIGSGSADAAATLRLLAGFWDVPVPLPDAPEVLALGADVPVCLRGPAPQIMAGIGEAAMPCPTLPNCAFVVVNPRALVPTGAVFAALAHKTNPAMDAMPEGMDLDGFVDWLAQQRNDLQAPAESIAPAVSDALARLRRVPQIRWAGMSGSGATCVGLVRDMAEARLVARAIQLSEMGWWVAPGQLLSSEAC